jgi:hypothetical protein
VEGFEFVGLEDVLQCWGESRPLEARGDSRDRSESRDSRDSSDSGDSGDSRDSRANTRMPDPHRLVIVLETCLSGHWVEQLQAMVPPR